MKGFHFQLRFVLVISLILCVLASTSKDQCGVNDCDEDVHNVWAEESEDFNEITKSAKQSVKADDKILEYFKNNKVTVSKLKLELILNFLDKDGDGQVDLGDLEYIQLHENNEFRIVESVVVSFDRWDKNEDALLSRSELPSVDEINGDNSFKDLTMLEYMNVLSSLDKKIKKSLKPFNGLSVLTAVEARKVIVTSIQQFKENDADQSGGLNMAEYLKQIEKSPSKRGEVLDEQQKVKIFGIIDKNGDGEISYGEFQAMIPQEPLNAENRIAQIFKRADQDSDGFLSEEEFAEHIKRMVAHTGAKEPNEGEIEQGFNQLDKDEDGKISKEEMMGINSEIEKIQEEKARKGFMDMDIDGNGQLSRDEMLVMVDLMQEKSGQTVDLDMLINMLDEDGNGFVDLEEVKKLVKKMAPPPPSHNSGTANKN